MKLGKWFWILALLILPSLVLAQPGPGGGTGGSIGGGIGGGTGGGGIPVDSDLRVVTNNVDMGVDRPVGGILSGQSTWPDSSWPIFMVEESSLATDDMRGWDPDIVQDRWYDSNDTFNGQPVYYGRYDLSLWYSGSFWTISNSGKGSVFGLAWISTVGGVGGITGPYGPLTSSTSGGTLTVLSGSAVDYHILPGYLRGDWISTNVPTRADHIVNLKAMTSAVAAASQTPVDSRTATNNIVMEDNTTGGHSIRGISGIVGGTNFLSANDFDLTITTSNNPPFLSESGDLFLKTADAPAAGIAGNIDISTGIGLSGGDIAVTSLVGEVTLGPIVVVTNVANTGTIYVDDLFVDGSTLTIGGQAITAVGGAITATKFRGDGSELTNIASGAFTDDGDATYSTTSKLDVAVSLNTNLTSKHAITLVGPPQIRVATFTDGGVGLPNLNDMTVNSGFHIYTADSNTTFRVEIQAEGTPDAYRWSDNGGATWIGTNNITAGADALQDAVEITFAATTGHDLGDYWDMIVTATSYGRVEVLDENGQSLSLGLAADTNNNFRVNEADFEPTITITGGTSNNFYFGRELICAITHAQIHSFNMGLNNTTDGGSHHFIFGEDCDIDNSSGGYCLAFGDNADITGVNISHAYSMGNATDANANRSFALGYINVVSGDGAGAFAGWQNTLTGARAFTGGGQSNHADGEESIALGQAAHADHANTFVWSDGDGAPDFTSTAVNQFLIDANGGVGIGTNAPSNVADGLHVRGPVQVDDLMAELSFIQDSSEATGAATTEQIVDFDTVPIVDAGFSATISNITVTSAGRYTVSLDVSFDTGGSAAETNIELYTNGTVAVDVGGNEIGFDRSTGAANNDGVAAVSKTLTLPASCTVDWRITTAAAETINWNYGTFRVERK